MSKIKELVESLDLSMSDEINTLTEGSDFSDEFKEKIKVLFETVIAEKVNSVVSKSEELLESTISELNESHSKEIDGLMEKAEEYGAFLQEKAEEYGAHLSTEHQKEIDGLMEKADEYAEHRIQEVEDKVDSYLSYVASEFVKENQIAIEQGFKVKMMENMINSFKKVFEENSINVIETEVSVVKDLEDKISVLESRVNKEIEEKIELKKLLEKSEESKIIDSLSEGMTLTQKERFVKLIENTSYSSDEERNKKFQIIAESITAASKNASVITEEIKEESTIPSVSDKMSEYLKVLNKLK